MLQCPNELSPIILDVLAAPWKENNIFVFLGFGMQIKGRQNIVSTSIYNNALIMLSWAFIRMYLEIFNPLSRIWAYNVFITFGLFSFHFIIIITFFEVAF